MTEDVSDSDDGWGAVQNAELLDALPAQSTPPNLRRQTSSTHDVRPEAGQQTPLSNATPSFYSRAGSWNSDSRFRANADDDDAGWEDEADSVIAASCSGKSYTSSGKRLGRPKGIRGSRKFRAEMKAMLEQDKDDQNQTKSRAEILEKARSAKRAKKVEQEQATLQDNSKSQSLVAMSADVCPAVGSEMQKRVVNSASSLLVAGHGFPLLKSPVSSASCVRLQGGLTPQSFIQSLFEGATTGDQENEAGGSGLGLKKFVDHIFCPYRGYCSITKDAEVFKLSDHTISRTVVRSAAALKAASSKLWGNFFEHLKSMLSREQHEGILFIVNFRFDETPSRIKIQDLDSAFVPDDRSRAGKSTQAPKQLAKLLQTELSISALIRKNEGESSSHMLITGYIPLPLQVLDKQTAENLKAALQDSMELPGLKTLAGKFQRQIFLFCTDEFTSNPAAQWALQCEHPGWKRLSTLCNIHKASTAQGAVFAVCGQTISAVINLALSMTGAGAVGRLQSMLRDILISRFELRIGDPASQISSAAKEYRQQVFDLFLSMPSSFAMEVSEAVSSRQRLHYTRRKKQRLILEFFFNGDLRSENICHWARPGQYISEEAALQTFLKYAIPALLPSAVPLFPRGRWFGADATLDYCGLLSGVHNLLQPLVERWSGKSISEDPTALQVGQSTDDDAVGWDVPGHGDPLQNLLPLVPVPPPIDAQNPSVDDVQNGPGGSVEPEEDSKADSGFDWHTYQKQLRVSVADWLRASAVPTGPSAATQLALMRQFMDPILQLMVHCLFLSSKRWTREELSKEARGQQRDYRVCLAHRGVEGIALLEKVAVLLASAPVALPERDLRTDISTLAFTMLARLGAAVHQLMVWRQRKFPYALRLGSAYSISFAVSVVANFTWLFV